MTEHESFKAEKLDNFNSWIETLENRVFIWLDSLPEKSKAYFNFSIESLDEVERYLISKYELNDLQDVSSKSDIDGSLSYVIKVFEENWPNTKYVIELDDEKNILFNIPAIVTQPQIGAAFSPFMFVRGILNLKRTGIFRKNLESRLKQYVTKYGEQE